MKHEAVKREAGVERGYLISKPALRVNELPVARSNLQNPTPNTLPVREQVSKYPSLSETFLVQTTMPALWVSSPSYLHPTTMTALVWLSVPLDCVT